MKPIMIVGLVLIVLGLVGLVVQGINYTSHENVVDVAGVKVTAETHKTVPIPLIAGLAALVAGVAVVIAASRKP